MSVSRSATARAIVDIGIVGIVVMGVADEHDAVGVLLDLGCLLEHSHVEVDGVLSLGLAGELGENDEGNSQFGR